MADPVQILVKSDPSPTQSQGDWIVKIGAGRGGRIETRHRQKSVALQKARREGRKRADKGAGAILKVQTKDGRWSTEARYGRARKRRVGGGFFSNLLGG